LCFSTRESIGVEHNTDEVEDMLASLAVVGDAAAAAGLKCVKGPSSRDSDEDGVVSADLCAFGAVA
jgi:hypothetical protein